MLALLCLALVAGTMAQVPVTCPGPKQFEGRFRRYERDQGGRGMVKGFIGYDETQRRIRVIEEQREQKEDSAYEYLIIHEQNIEYRVDLHTRKCNITQPREPFRPIGVPPDSKFLYEGVIGAAGVAGETVTVAGFGAQFEGNEFEVTVTYPNCFPVTHAFKGKDGHLDMTTFYDLQNGISDPELFFPPKECSVPNH
ncbi:hypothetical protein RRG08_033761 [Elysia crispata]|uniref:Uncharacterized protein n=1 Tax=Elysia crispata TaxID=231223 RepID=A0AAE1ASE0_9GAST|nr:hypothetical protein RRG08_033761 [Elysia crispata]